jgi:F-type H+-transporting ATPase subunit epsilon
MAGTFKFELVSPEKVMVSGDANEVIVPGMDGQFTVMAGHAPVISTLRPGTLHIKLAGGERQIFVRGGIVEVEPDSLTILAQHLIDLGDANRGPLLEAELKAAEATLAASKDDHERMAAQDTLTQLRALNAH